MAFVEVGGSGMPRLHVFGVALSRGCVTASLLAILSAVNRAMGRTSADCRNGSVGRGAASSIDPGLSVRAQCA